MSVNTLLNGILDINVKNITANSLNAPSSANHNLIIDGTTTFKGNNHIGQAVIPHGAMVSAPVHIDNMNNDAVILITSREPNTGIWVVPTDDSFTVHTGVAVAADTRIDYFVLHAE